MRPVDWDELVRVCQQVGCRHGRTKGDHIAMVRQGMARPVIIPRKKGLTEDIVLGIVRTRGMTKREFLEQLEGTKRSRKAASRDRPPLK